MAYADEVFIKMCRDIIDNGTDTTGELVRPTWEDTGEKAYTIKKFGVCNRYDLRKEFPILTLRRTGIKSATDEMLWIYQKKSNRVNELNSHIWDQWADDHNTIGKAYGYQIGERYIHHNQKITKESLEELQKQYNSARIGSPGYWHKDLKDITYNSIVHEMQLFGMTPNNIFAQMRNMPILLDQMDSVIWDLKHNPYSRRIMTNTYNFHDLSEMALYPCAYSMTFNCTKDKETGKLVLNGLLNQRSQDVLAANNWNVVQYAVLIYMLAQVCDMIPGEFVHMISDCHIYDRHIPMVEELISREPYPAPKFWLNPDVKNFYDFTPDDVHLENYQYGPQIKNIPIAV